MQFALFAISFHYSISTTRLHRLKGLSRLRSGWVSGRPLFFSDTDHTDWRDFFARLNKLRKCLACARDWHLWDPEYLWLFYFEHRLHELIEYARLRSGFTSVRSQISVVYFLEHGLHKSKGLYRLRSGWVSVESRISVVYLFEHGLHESKGLYRLRSGWVSVTCFIANKSKYLWSNSKP